MKYIFSPLDLDKIEKHIMTALSNISSYDTSKETETFDINSIIARMESDKVNDVTDQLWCVLRCMIFVKLKIRVHKMLETKFFFQFAVASKTYCMR